MPPRISKSNAGASPATHLRAEGQVDKWGRKPSRSAVADTVQETWGMDRGGKRESAQFTLAEHMHSLRQRTLDHLLLLSCSACSFDLGGPWRRNASPPSSHPSTPLWLENKHG